MQLRLVFPLIFSSVLSGQGPAALILDSGGATVKRPSNDLAISLPSGELLYPGDEVVGGSSPLSLQFCASKERIRYAPRSTLAITAREIQLRSGSVEQRTPVSVCTLPDLPAVHEPRFYGAALARDVNLPTSQAPLSADQRRELDPIEQGLAAEPNNVTLLLAKGAALERFGLHGEAADVYRRLEGAWTNVDWPRSLLHRVREKQRQRGEAENTADLPGKTYALVVGVSGYPKLRPNEQLRFAHRDALTFASYLRSAKGGALPADQLRLLLNEQATTAAIRNGIATFLRARARKQDTVILFLATHGVVDQDGYILTHDSDPEDLRSTALPMREIQSLLEEEFAHVGRVLVYVDACRAGTIGAISRQTDVHRIIEVMLRMDGAEILGILASGRGEVSFESDRFGGGHGAFSYFLLRGLNGDADEDSNGIVESGELIKYVRDRVREATLRAQNPKEQGNMPDDARLVNDTRADGIQLSGWQPLDPEIARRRARGLAAPPDPSSAGEQQLEALNRQRIELQNKGQEVILRYLRGEAVPQRKEDFAAGERYFRAALAIDPDALAIESRALFCQGRALLFDKRFDEGVTVLERAARIDPAGAYTWNALGIAYLERAEYTRAAEAFRDAIRRAPFWAYPRHNLALAFTELGDSGAAQLAYKQAIEVAPLTAYLRYNHGLLLGRVNLQRDAETEIKRAIRLAPEEADPYNALGFLYASRGKRKQAEAQYRIAIGKDEHSPLARHNLALLLSTDRKRSGEAVTLWQENTRLAPEFTASRISLAATLADAGRMNEGIAELENILKVEPDLISARLALATIYQKTGKMVESINHLRYVAPRTASAAVWEQLGDGRRATGQTGDAREAYQEALRLSAGRKDKRRIEDKLRGIQ
jgi:tetratricopeptide (TPR) repeat protein